MVSFIRFSIIAVLVSTTSIAQTFKTVEVVEEIKTLKDDWYKYATEDAKFDVEVISGELNKGNITWFDGSSYSGGFKNNSLYGKGTYKLPSGIIYEGDFKNNMRHGKGSLILQDGTKWSGKWKENKKNGKGKVFNSEGEIIKTGVWEMDVFKNE